MHLVRYSVEEHTDNAEGHVEIGQVHTTRLVDSLAEDRSAVALAAMV
jgi:hypothetical protein